MSYLELFLGNGGGGGGGDTVNNTYIKYGLDKVDSIAEMETLTPANNDVVYLNSGGRSGVFKFDSSNLSSAVTADTLQGVYIAPSSDDTGASGAWVRDIEDYLRPEWFGAAGDWNYTNTTPTDDSQAFKACFSVIEFFSRVGHRLDWKLFSLKMKLNGKSYYLTENNIIDFSFDCFGFVLSGLKRESTLIVYEPAGENYSFINNNDNSAAGKIENFTFISKGTEASTCKFYNIYSHYRVFQWDFIDLNIRGDYYSQFFIDGPNLGSEMRWLRCSFTGNMSESCVYIPSTASDQMVNYNFEMCNAGPTSGHFVRMDKGGAVIVNGLSWTALEGRTTQGYYFYFPTGDHSSGSSRFQLSNVRYEPKTDQLMGILYCRWKTGTISISDYHDDINTFEAGWDSTQEIFNIGWDNSDGPIVHFKSCILAGKHGYHPSGTEAWKRKVNIKYDLCNIKEHTQPSEFLLTDLSGVNSSTLPFIEFNKCAFKKSSLITDPAQQVDEHSYGWSQSSSTINNAKLKQIYIFDGKGVPSTGLNSMLFPSRSLLKNLIVNIPAGQYVSTSTKTFTVATSESTPTVLATVTVSNLSLGHSEVVQINKMLLTDEERLITYIADGTTARPSSVGACVFAFEYVG